MLEEENLELFEFEDRLEYIIGKCVLYQENGKF